ncbi:RNase P subunit p30 [Toxoplasma gondii ARI]|uniref:RNase P subunit p30 n=1 Tax=Toxoplasma gondii ARI TaxID=1074872 RepID=A0A139XPY9_TOXGO|nr:RNase P subunit p30 [Toxoplasma gondii ARI]
MTTHFELRLEAPPGAETPEDLLASPAFSSLLSRASFLGYKVVAVNVNLHLPLPPPAPSLPFSHPLRYPLPILQTSKIYVAKGDETSCSSSPPPCSASLPSPSSPSSPSSSSGTSSTSRPSSLSSPLTSWLPPSLSPFHVHCGDPRQLRPESGGRLSVLTVGSRVAEQHRPASVSPSPAHDASLLERLPPSFVSPTLLCAPNRPPASESPSAAPASFFSAESAPVLCVPRATELSAAPSTTWADFLPYGTAATHVCQSCVDSRLRQLRAARQDSAYLGDERKNNDAKPTQTPQAPQAPQAPAAAAAAQPRASELRDENAARRSAAVQGGANGFARDEEPSKAAALASADTPVEGETDASSRCAQAADWRSRLVSRGRCFLPFLACPQSPVFSCDLLQLRRVTIVLHTVNSAASFASLFPPNPPFYAKETDKRNPPPSCIDILAVQPTDDATWQFACSSCECDLIAIDFSGSSPGAGVSEKAGKPRTQASLLAASLDEEEREEDVREKEMQQLRLPFTVRRRHIQQALRRGLHFEINLAPFLAPLSSSSPSPSSPSSPSSSRVFRAALSNVQQLLRFVPPERLLLSAGASAPEHLLPPALVSALFAGLRISAASKVSSAAAVLSRGAAKQAAGGGCLGGWIGAGL